MDLHIDGTLTPIAPLHLAAPGEARVDPASLQFTSNPNATTCTRTYRQRVVNYTGQGGYNAVPVIPANNLRGHLRRAAADLIEAELRGKGETLDLFTYNAIRTGLPHGNPEGKLPSVAEYREADSHVFFGLFGGGPRLLPSYHHLVTNTVFPVVPSTIEGGFVPEHYRETVYTKPIRSDAEGEATDAGWGDPLMTQVLFFRRIDDTLQFLDPQAEGVIANYLEAVDEWQSLVGRATEVEKAEPRYLAGIEGFNALEVVIPGVPFRLSIEAPDLTDAQAGFLLKAVQRLHATRWGGWVRNGFGSAVLDLTIPGEDGAPIRPFVQNDGEVALDTANPLVNRLNEAAEDALEALTAAELTGFMALGPNSQEKLDNARAQKAKKEG